MLTAIAQRVGRAILLMWFVTVITFLTLRLTPGDPAELLLGPAAADPDSAALVQELRHTLGLDRSVVVQYGTWIGRLLRGDLGTSNQSGTAILPTVLAAASPTVWLIVLSLVVAVPISVLLGLGAARARSRWVDATVRHLSSLAMATPGFWIGLLFIIFFAVKLGALPSTGYTSPQVSFGGFLEHMILPVATLSIYLIGILVRFVHLEATTALQSDFTRTARAMGISRGRTTWVYTLRNAVLPMITVVGVQMGSLIGGAVLVEQVFGLGGLGQLMLQGVLNRDYPTVQGAVLFTTAAVVLATTLADVIRSVVDPRIR
ncbi:ABC transporter permease [Nakamurella lactea]|uniref:ABC transporter permease n=1 Tax=Nakamurella lactea TaxID=459515 RepID=UPI00040B0CC0|nr:ABC transporter permease [Nakamurella lactea]